VRVPLPLTFFAAAALLGLAACGGGSSTPTGGSPTSGTAVKCGGSGGTAATIQNFAFSPASATVSSGATVTWTNNDSTTHTVTFDSGPDCGRVAAGASVSAQFSVPGTYTYHCSIHSSMKGSVTVSG
jgi:plastocyanin